MCSNANISICQGSLFSVNTETDSQNQLVLAGPLGSPEKAVIINKELIPKQDVSLSSKTRCVFVEIQFFKLKKDFWGLKNLEAYEFIDKDLVLDPDSIRYSIIKNISDIKRYKTDLTAPELKKLTGNIKLEDNIIRISEPKEIDSTCALVFWYNVTLTKTGTFDLNTILIANPEINIYSNVEKSLRIHVENYDIVTPYFILLKELIWIIIVFSGIFTFYKQIIQKETIDPGSYHLTDFFKGMCNEIIILIKKIPSLLIIIIVFFIELFFTYIYLSMQYPEQYPSLSEYIQKNSDSIRIFSPIIFTLLIAIILFSIKKGIGDHLHDVLIWMEKMPPAVALIHFVLYHIVIFAIYIVVNQVK